MHMTTHQKPRFEELRKYMLARYEQQLSDKLYYHGVHHVLDVEQSVIRIAASMSLAATDLLLLRTAAIFHDYGFIVSHHQHEERSCVAAREILPQFGFNHPSIEMVCGMNMATALPQKPTTMLEKIIADVDLDYLGRDDYPEIADSLFRELQHQQRVNDRQEWLRIQVDFLQRHQYHTEWSLAHRSAQKEARYLLLPQELN